MKITIQRGKTTIERDATPEEVQNLAGLGNEEALTELGVIQPAEDDAEDEAAPEPVRPRVRRSR